MQYNQNYRYQRCFFFKRFKIGCQSPYAKKIGEQCNVALGSGEKEMNYIYSFYTAPRRLVR